LRKTKRKIPRRYSGAGIEFFVEINFIAESAPVAKRGSGWQRLLY